MVPRTPLEVTLVDPGIQEEQKGLTGPQVTGSTQESMFMTCHLVRSQKSHDDEHAQCFLVTFPARFTLMGKFDRKDPNVGDLPAVLFHHVFLPVPVQVPVLGPVSWQLN